MMITTLILATAQLPVSGYKMVWNDEFSYRGLPDPKKWTHEEGYLRNDEKQYYTKERLENAYVKDGNLTLQARKDGYMGKEITSGSITTEKTFTFTYGYVEVRAKVPTGKGTWPAIWMLGTNIRTLGWPQCGEIDIMENVGFDPDKVHFNVHTKAYNHVLGTNKSANRDVSGFSDAFHVYGMEWTPTVVRCFFDGKQVLQFDKEADDDTKWPFYRPQYLILNLAIGGAWGGLKGIDDKIFPSKYTVDYARIYQKANKVRN
jgi:beta-glucanase (GH16 family)